MAEFTGFTSRGSRNLICRFRLVLAACGPGAGLRRTFGVGLQKAGGSGEAGVDRGSWQTAKPSLVAIPDQPGDFPLAVGLPLVDNDLLQIERERLAIVAREGPGHGAAGKSPIA